MIIARADNGEKLEELSEFILIHGAKLFRSKLAAMRKSVNQILGNLEYGTHNGLCG